MSTHRRVALTTVAVLVTAVSLIVLSLLVGAHPAQAAVLAPTPPTPPTAPVGPVAPADPGLVSIDVGGKPSNSITLILALTVLSVAPAVLLLCTSFTKIVVVLSLTRNALGLQASPPNQVLAGLALFLTMFVMGPTISAVNHDAVQPYLNGRISASQMYDAGSQPVREFLLHNTRKDELAMFTKIAKQDQPASEKDVPMSTLVPAFALSELKSAFIIGMIIFIPFLVIDMLVAAGLMSMGMMMVPPIIVSLPFKLLVFVLVDGWSLIVKALVQSYG